MEIITFLLFFTDLIKKKQLMYFIYFVFFNPLSARIFTVFGHSLLEDIVLHKEAWVAKLLGTHLSI